MKYLVLLLMFSMSASAIELGFEWDPPADPTLVDETRLYLTGGTVPVGVAIMPASTLTVDMVDLTPGRYCFVATHANTDMESGYSNEVCVRVPGKPERLRVKKF